MSQGRSGEWGGADFARARLMTAYTRQIVGYIPPAPAPWPMRFDTAAYTRLGTPSEFLSRVSLDLANLYAQAVTSDQLGVPNSLNAEQIAEFHRDYFTSLGLPGNAFGGDAWFVPEALWYKGCD